RPDRNRAYRPRQRVLPVRRPPGQPRAPQSPPGLSHTASDAPLPPERHPGRLRALLQRQDRKSRAGAVTTRAKIKFAVVGAGGWGLHHARVFSERSDVDFCAVFGRTAERTRARAEPFGVRAYTDLPTSLETDR